MLFLIGLVRFVVVVVVVFLLLGTGGDVKVLAATAAMAMDSVAAMAAFRRGWRDGGGGALFPGDATLGAEVLVVVATRSTTTRRIRS